MLKYNKFSRDCMDLLRLRTLPIGIKLFEKAADIPSSFEL